MCSASRSGAVRSSTIAWRSAPVLMSRLPSSPACPAARARSIVSTRAARPSRSRRIGSTSDALTSWSPRRPSRRVTSPSMSASAAMSCCASAEVQRSRASLRITASASRLVSAASFDASNPRWASSLRRWTSSSWGSSFAMTSPAFTGCPTATTIWTSRPPAVDATASGIASEKPRAWPVPRPPPRPIHHTAMPASSSSGAIRPMVRLMMPWRVGTETGSSDAFICR